MVIADTYTTHYNELLKFATNIHSKQESTDLVSESYIWLMKRSDNDLNRYLDKRKPIKIIQSAIYWLSKRLKHSQKKFQLTNDFNHIIDEPSENTLLQIYEQLTKKELKICNAILNRKKNGLTSRNVSYRKKKLKQILIPKLKQNDY